MRFRQALAGGELALGEGPNAFCSGGDQTLRGEGGYDDGTEPVPRLSVLDLQVGEWKHGLRCATDGRGYGRFR